MSAPSSATYRSTTLCVFSMPTSIFPTNWGKLRVVRTIDMDQEGFTLFAMGFTGPKALQFKRLYIRAFNAAMEEIHGSTQRACDTCTERHRPDVINLRK
ncbi:MAG: Rha family transcriptional regulator [Phreatobacter sp.]|uniref:Rha family transcriptional regulator n=1 Tax=Phreatobacter sp. TaxID=1966341 RepID=UPI001A4928C5|nr:Rha family transcriptional regulator [Phreatobacter sp.]